MKWFMAILIFSFTSAFACSYKNGKGPSKEDFDKMVMQQLKRDWQLIPRYKVPKYDTLKFQLSSIKKDETSGYYLVKIHRGETICKELSFSAVPGTDGSCKPKTSLVSIQGCPSN